MHIIPLIISWVCFVGFIIGIGFTAKAYVNSEPSYNTSTCEILNCTYKANLCGGKKRFVAPPVHHCEDEYDIGMLLSLTVNGTEYTRWEVDAFYGADPLICNGTDAVLQNTTTCYYNTDIEQTLTAVQPTASSDDIVGLAFLTLGAIVSLLIAIALAILFVKDRHTPIVV